MNILSLFDGMSCGQIALDRLNVNIKSYYASEIDQYAIAVCRNNFPATVQLGSVEYWKSWNINWGEIDILIGGSPCQGFSLAGKQLAFDDPRSKLFFTYVDILNHIKTINPNIKFLLENVKMKSDYMDTISDMLGVTPVLFNSDLVSAQYRTRYYWANWNITLPNDKGISYRDIVTEPNMKASTVRKGNPRQIVFTGDKFPCLTASYYKGINADGRPSISVREGAYNVIKDSGGCRMLTPNECESLQTVPIDYTKGVSNTQRYKMLGNGWTVDVIASIFNCLLNNPNQRKIPTLW